MNDAAPRRPVGLLRAMVATPGLLVGLLLVVLLAALCGSTGAADAAGPAGATRSRAAATATSTEIFSGDVVRVQRVRGVKKRGRPRPVTTTRYSVDVRQVYRGPIRSQRVVVRTVAAAEGCARGILKTGTLYVFSVPRRSKALVETTCGQVQPGTGARIRSLTQRFPDAHPPVSSPSRPTPAAVTLQDQSVSAPLSFTRLAAPGLAVVLIGLLGLVVVRRLGRQPR